jgi:cell wall-associated NlpC family hydrolase
VTYAYNGVVRAVILVYAAVCATACASTGAVPKPFPGATVPKPPAPVAPRGVAPPSAPLLIATALSYRGVPYRNGGSDPAGFDCSGFVQWVFAQHGVAMPREVRDQFEFGDKVKRGDVEPGDLVFFETVSKGASHVGIALGNDQFVHAPSSRGVVRIERYTSEYWQKRYVGARRVTGAAHPSS